MRRANKRDVTKAPAGTRRARPDEPPRSGKGATTAAWREYAEDLGLELDDDAGRGAIIALVDEHGDASAAVDEDGWHPIVRDWYESLAESGQAAFYEASDWMTARLLAEAMSRELNPQPMRVTMGEDTWIEHVTVPPKGASLSAWFKAMANLLVTEGDRRRVQLELERTADEDDAEPAASVTDIRSWRESLNG